jgi:membrane-bound serine protease (ClpP class)
MKTTLRFGWLGLTVLVLFLAVPKAVAQSRPLVVEIDQTGTVDPLSAHYVERALDGATARHAAVVVVRIDTPGGLDSSMRRIIQAISASETPVLCWVGPPGARAASAGTFILISCPFAAMAPGTNVGAAHPVGITGDILPEKVTNDAAAYIRSLAEAHGRNANWAEKAVRDSVSITAEDAKRLEVIDLVVPSLSELLRQTQGLTVPVAGGQVTLDTEGATVEIARMGLADSLFHGLIDPNIAFLLFVFGLAGIVYEVLHPGLNVAGLVGLIMLVAFFVIAGMLPVNVAGLVLIAAAIGFFVVDLKVAGHGLPTVAGITCLVLGGLFLFNPAVPNARVSRTLVVAVSIALGVFFALVVRSALRVRGMAPETGVQTIVGSIGTVSKALDPLGIVLVESEHWSARSKRGKLAAGTRIRVVGVDKLTLEVEPVDAGSELQPEGEGVR